MTSNLLSDEQIQTIESKLLDQYSWFVQLGVGSKPDLNSSDNDVSFPFFERGRQIWEASKPMLVNILCDKEKKAIKGTIDEGVLGNARELILFLYFELTNTHNIAISIAIPLIAIVIKFKLNEFCSNT